MIIKIQKRILYLVITFLIILFGTHCIAEKEAFEIKRIGNINPYADNVFAVVSAEDGMITIRIHDTICIYRTITEKIAAGENRIHWDGCGYNEEKLYEKVYTITAELTTESGHIYTKSFNSPIEYPLQCLQYAMPSSEFLHLDAPDEWFVEYRTVTDGTVCFDVYPEGQSQITETYTMPASGGKIGRKDYDSIKGKKQLKPGKYNISFYEKTRPEKKYNYSLEVSEKSPEKKAIQPTGEIMPDRDMSEAEIWKMMMQPSVVVDIDFFKHQDVYSGPDADSKSLGTLHGQTQGLKVISTEGEWALIGAWNHEDASYIEGWVPLAKLKYEYPSDRYGILIDKQKQTLSVYQNGSIIDTLIISSGRAEKNRLYQETSAGCFLTGYHRVNFSMNGKKYDYVIQYDGGNLLHQTPYEWGHNKKDFTQGRGFLGAKASHACIRIQPEPGPGGINAFWIFTHLPYHTRVIILDDQEQRNGEMAKLTREKNSSADLSKLHIYNDEEKLNHSEKTVKITFGGSVTPGGRKAFNSKKDSFASFIENNGYESAFAGIQNIITADDLTCVGLSCVIQSSAENERAVKAGKIAAKGTENIFGRGSVELVRIISEDVINGGQTNYVNTVNAVLLQSNVIEEGTSQIIELQGHFFGFAGCSEQEYLKNPETIDRLISDLKEKSCERIIFLASWGEAGKTEHSIIQEAMARRSIHAGADLVVGEQACDLLGADFIEGIPVFYSLGNLLDGSTADKPKKQQGILLRAEFSFEKETDPVNVTVVPVLAGGNNQNSHNTYSPTYALNQSESRSVINQFWSDTPDQIFESISFYVPDGL